MASLSYLGAASQFLAILAFFFFLILPGKFWKNALIRSRPYPTTHFQIHHSQFSWATLDDIRNSDNSNILLPLGHPVADYAFLLVFSSLISFLSSPVLEDSSYAKCDQSSLPSFASLYVGCSFFPLLSAIILHLSHDRSHWSLPSISISKFSRHFWSVFRNVQVSAPYKAMHLTTRHNTGRGALHKVINEISSNCLSAFDLNKALSINITKSMLA